MLQEGSQDWQQSEDGSIQWFSRSHELAAGQRTLGHRAHLGFPAARAGFVATAGQPCAGQLGAQVLASGHRRFACEADARAALERELKGKPTWLEIHSDVVAHPRHAGKGRPRKEASPTDLTSGRSWRRSPSINNGWTKKRCARPVSLSAPMNWRARRSPITSW